MSHKTCAHCAQPFIVDPRVGNRHRYCDGPACRRASRRLSQAKWLNKPENTQYHRGPDQVEHNRAWRLVHPAYRSQQRQKMQRRLRRALSRELADSLVSCGLQDLNYRKLALILGLVGRIYGSGLQDQMAATLRRIMFGGYAILRGSEIL